MNKQLVLDKSGGFPFDQSTLELLQSNTQAIVDGVSSVFGTNVILSGVTDLGANYSDGYVIIDGELLPFVGGTKATYIVIEEVVTQLTFPYPSPTLKDAEKVRVAKTANIGSIALTQFVRMGELSNLYKQADRDDLMYKPGMILHVKMSSADIATHFDVNNNYIGISDTWKGWQIDPHAMGNIIVGWDPSDTDFDNPNGSQKGGEKDHRLTSEESGIAPHNHSFNFTTTNDGTSTGVFVQAKIGTEQNRPYDTSEHIGASAKTPHNNMQPYVVYLTVIKL